MDTLEEQEPSAEEPGEAVETPGGQPGSEQEDRAGEYSRLIEAFLDEGNRAALQEITRPNGTVLTARGEREPGQLLDEACRRGWQMYEVAKERIYQKHIVTMQLPHDLLSRTSFHVFPGTSPNDLLRNILWEIKQLRQHEERQEVTRALQPANFVEDPILENALTVPELRAMQDGFGMAALHDGRFWVGVKALKAAGTLKDHSDDISRMFHHSLQNRYGLDSWRVADLELAPGLLGDPEVAAQILWPELKLKHDQLEPAEVERRAAAWEHPETLTAEQLVDLIRQDGVYATHVTAYPLEAIEHGGLRSTTGHNVAEGRDPTEKSFLHASETVHVSVNDVYYREGSVIQQRGDPPGTSRLRTVFLMHPGTLLPSHLAQRPWSQWLGEPTNDTGFRGKEGVYGEAAGDEIPITSTILLVPKHELVNQHDGRPISRNQTNHPLRAESDRERWRADGVVTAQEYWQTQLERLQKEGKPVPKIVFFYAGKSLVEGLQDFERTYQIPPEPNLGAFRQVLDEFVEEPVQTTAQGGEQKTYYRYTRKPREGTDATSPTTV